MHASLEYIVRDIKIEIERKRVSEQRRERDREGDGCQQVGEEENENILASFGTKEQRTMTVDIVTILL